LVFWDEFKIFTAKSASVNLTPIIELPTMGNLPIVIPLSLIMPLAHTKFPFIIQLRIFLVHSALPMELPIFETSFIHDAPIRVSEILPTPIPHIFEKVSVVSDQICLIIMPADTLPMCPSIFEHARIKFPTLPIKLGPLHMPLAHVKLSLIRDLPIGPIHDPSPVPLAIFETAPIGQGTIISKIVASAIPLTILNLTLIHFTAIVVMMGYRGLRVFVGNLLVGF
jgi:hypothetical protein